MNHTPTILIEQSVSHYKEFHTQHMGNNLCKYPLGGLWVDGSCVELSGGWSGEGWVHALPKSVTLKPVKTTQIDEYRNAQPSNEKERH